MENKFIQKISASLKNGSYSSDEYFKQELFYSKKMPHALDDMTDRKKLEMDLAEAKEKIIAANKAKTEFLENMRHDIRTPLAGIVSFSKMIEDRTDDPLVKEYASNLTASSYALSDLLNEILEITKTNAGLSVVQNKFDLKKRLHDIFQLNRACAYQKEIELIFEYDANIPQYILGDSRRIHRIVLELMNNAIQFTNHGSVKLKVALVREIERDLIIKLTVEDTGIGIDPRDQEVIFCQFKRLTPSCEGIYKGVGIGLSMVKKFVEDLHGEIYVASQVGHGSKFTCVLSLKKPLLNDDLGVDDTTYFPNKYISNENKSIHNTLTSSAQNESPSTRILLIEDQPLAAKAVTTMFENFGYAVDIAVNGSLALLLIQEKKYDLIFMDIGLPDMDGYEVTKQIRSAGIYIPIIALSAHIEVEHTQHCLSVGMSAVLTKPLKKEKAIEIFNTFLPPQSISYDEKHDEDKNDLNLSPTVVDFTFIKNNLGDNEKLMKEMLMMYLKSLPDESAKIQSSYESKDWTHLKATLHQLKGSGSYCGTIRVNQICTYLEEAITLEKQETISSLYPQLLAEMQKVKEAILKKAL